MSGINRAPDGFLKNPKLPRSGEVIGGGWFVFRRGDSTGRIRPSQWPFEYDTQKAAEAQAWRLAAKQPGYVFDVVHAVSHIAFPAMSMSSGEVEL